MRYKFTKKEATEILDRILEADKIHKLERKFHINSKIRHYQKKKIYIDEYSDQEKLREEFFESKNYWKRLNENLRNVVKCMLDSYCSVEEFKNSFKIKKEQSPYQHFTNRFMKRN